VKEMTQMIEDSDVVTLTPEAVSAGSSLSLRGHVRQALQNYIKQLDGQTPVNLYGLVLADY
jgi:hypothetical protein